MEQTINLQQGTKILVTQNLSNQITTINKYEGSFIGFINMGNIIFLNMNSDEKSLLIPLHTIIAISYNKTEIVILKPRIQL